MDDPVIARVGFCGNEFGLADVTIQPKLDPKTVRVSGPTNKAPIGTTIQQIFAPYLRLATIKLSYARVPPKHPAHTGVRRRASARAVSR